MLSLRRFVTVAAPIACAAILMCSGAAFGQFHGDGVSDPPVPQGPAAPTEFVAHPGNDTVLLQWNPSTGPNLAGYKVYRSLTSGGGFQLIGSTEDEWYPDNNVDNGTTYYHKVRAYDIFNRQGPPTPEQEAEPLADYPSAAVTYPVEGTVEGEVDVEMSAQDPYGENPGLVDVALLVDGSSQGADTTDPLGCCWWSFTQPNSGHVLQAIATDLDGNPGYGVPVRVNTDNFISELAASSPEVSPNDDGQDETVTFTAVLSAPAYWVVTVQDMSGGLIVEFEGTGADVSATWDGMAQGGGDIDDGIYTYKVWADHTPPAEVGQYVGRSVTTDAEVEVLACAGRNVKEWPWRLEHVRNAAKWRGLKWKTLPPQLATWDRVSSILDNDVCCVFHVVAHGAYWPLAGYWRTFFELDERVLSWHVDHPAWGDCPDVDSLGLWDSGRFRFVFMDSCLSGQASDMAFVFGMYSSDNYTNENQTYVGWLGTSGDDTTYTDFEGEYWSRFSTGYSVSMSLWWAGWEVSQEVYDNAVTYGFPDSTLMPPP